MPAIFADMMPIVSVRLGRFPFRGKKKLDSGSCN